MTPFPHGFHRVPGVLAHFPQDLRGLHDAFGFPDLLFFRPDFRLGGFCRLLKVGFLRVQNSFRVFQLFPFLFETQPGLVGFLLLKEMALLKLLAPVKKVLA